MALIPCPDCGRNVSTRAAACPNCGCPPYTEDKAPPTAVLEPRARTLALRNDGQALAAAPAPAVPAAQQQGVAVTRVHTAAASLLHCPRCGSEHVRRLNLIFREGLAVVKTGTAGVGFGDDGMAVGGARTGGTQQSLASMGAAPPEKRPMGGPVAMVAAALIAILVGASGSAGALVVGLVLAAVAGMWAYGSSHYNNHVYPALHQQWETSYSCTRCAEVFVWQGPAA